MVTEDGMDITGLIADAVKWMAEKSLKDTK